MNTIPDKSSQLVTELPYYDHHHHLSDIALRYLLITLGPIINISSLLSELCTLHTPYCRHNAGGRGGSASYYCLCFQLGVIICYAVSPSAVSSLFINNITHILAQSVPHRGQTKPAPHHDERQMIVIKTCYIMFFESLDFNLCDYSDVHKLYD